MNAQPPSPKFMRPRRYAERISVNWRTVYSWIDQGLLPGYRFAGVLLVDTEEADSIIRGMQRPVPVLPKKKVKK